MADRRRYSRQNLVDLPYLSVGGDQNGGMLLNISEDGIGFQVALPVRPGQRLSLAFNLDAKTPVHIHCQVAWTDVSGKRGGAQFLDVPDESRRFIREWLFLNSFYAAFQDQIPSEEAQPSQESPVESQRFAPAVIVHQDPASHATEGQEKPTAGAGASQSQEAASVFGLSPAPPDITGPGTIAEAQYPAAHTPPTTPPQRNDALQGFHWLSQIADAEVESQARIKRYREWVLTIVILCLIVLALAVWLPLMRAHISAPVMAPSATRPGAPAPAQSGQQEATPRYGAGQSPASQPAARSPVPLVAAPATPAMPRLAEPLAPSAPEKVAPSQTTRPNALPEPGRTPGNQLSRNAVNAPSATPPSPSQPPAGPDSSAPGHHELEMGLLYLSGRRVERNTSRAAEFLWQAVEQGNPAAAVLLAQLYLQGDGVPKRCDQARVLLQSAAGSGRGEAAALLQRLNEFGCR